MMAPKSEPTGAEGALLDRMVAGKRTVDAVTHPLWNEKKLDRSTASSFASDLKLYNCSHCTNGTCTACMLRKRIEMEGKALQTLDEQIAAIKDAYPNLADEYIARVRASERVGVQLTLSERLRDCALFADGHKSLVHDHKEGHATCPVCSYEPCPDCAPSAVINAQKDYSGPHGEEEGAPDWGGSGPKKGGSQTPEEVNRIIKAGKKVVGSILNTFGDGGQEGIGLKRTKAQRKPDGSYPTATDALSTMHLGDQLAGLYGAAINTSSDDPDADFAARVENTMVRLLSEMPDDPINNADYATAGRVANGVRDEHGIRKFAEMMGFTEDNLDEGKAYHPKKLKRHFWNREHQKKHPGMYEAKTELDDLIEELESKGGPGSGYFGPRPKEGDSDWGGSAPREGGGPKTSPNLATVASSRIKFQKNRLAREIVAHAARVKQIDEKPFRGPASRIEARRHLHQIKKKSKKLGIPADQAWEVIDQFPVQDQAFLAETAKLDKNNSTSVKVARGVAAFLLRKKIQDIGAKYAPSPLIEEEEVKKLSIAETAAYLAAYSTDPAKAVAFLDALKEGNITKAHGIRQKGFQDARSNTQAHLRNKDWLTTAQEVHRALERAQTRNPGMRQPTQREFEKIVTDIQNNKSRDLLRQHRTTHKPPVVRFAGFGGEP